MPARKLNFADPDVQADVRVLLSNGNSVEQIARTYRQPVTKMLKLLKKHGLLAKADEAGDYFSLILARFKEGYDGQHGRKTFAELGLRECAFPIDQPDGGLLYCGLAAHPGSRYCQTHSARCERRQAA